MFIKFINHNEYKSIPNSYVKKLKICKKKGGCMRKLQASNDSTYILYSALILV